jgi:deoxyribodipyrimidine photo-lyase
MQMQSGTTGINIPRVYNPIKQAQDHDPRGVFVRRWLPALRRVPDSWLFEPWRMPAELQARCGLRVGVEIAEPLVDIEAATRAAKKRLFELRAQPEVRAAIAQIVDKHGPRKRTVTGSKSSAKKPTAQMILEF